MRVFKIEVDTTLDAAYIRLSDNPVVTTAAVSDEINVDLDEHNVLVGIECLALDAKIPYSKLTQDFHLHSQDEAKVRSLLPSIQKSKIQGNFQGVSVVRPATMHNTVDA